MSINHHPPNVRKIIKNATKRIIPSSNLVQVGDWILMQDEGGNLLAQHYNTQYKVVLAATPPVNTEPEPEPEAQTGPQTEEPSG